MRHTLVIALLAALAVTACDDEPSRPSGPVTLRFIDDSLTSGIQLGGELTLDDTIDVTIPGTVANLPRGPHEFVGRLNFDYLPFSFTGTIDPPSSTIDVHPLNLQEPACRVAAASVGGAACGRGNVIFVSPRTRLFCPTSDYGEVCTTSADRALLGLTWPDSGQAVSNVYLSHGKLLVGAILGAGAPASAQGDTLAMALYQEGDYSTRRRLHPTTSDSSRWQEEVWTDSRFFPVYPAIVPVLDDTLDRGAANFGLAVRLTALLPQGLPNAILFRFDVKNISAADSFRYVHPEVPAGGQTLTDVYLAPFFDPDVGGGLQPAEAGDDNSTAFPAESLLVSWDQTFNVSTFAGSYRTAPGLVGIQLVAGPPATTAKPVIVSNATDLTYVTNAREDSTYAILSGGRAGFLNAQRCASTASALVCSGETANDTRVGWSVGPIPQLAPGDSTFVVVAILLAPPKAGAFTSGTAVAPEHSRMSDPTRSIYVIAEPLRALAAQVKTVVVSGAPGLR